jgi:Flp pilus assembly protein TadD
MTTKSRKQRLEEMLAEDPGDSFLRYGLAMEHISAGANEEGVQHLQELLRRDPSYVPAYLQAGQALLRLGSDDEARAVLRAGITVANQKGEAHAAGEMAGFLDSIGE